MDNLLQVGGEVRKGDEKQCCILPGTAQNKWKSTIMIVFVSAAKRCLFRDLF